jgi:hypothetical protein
MKQNVEWNDETGQLGEEEAVETKRPPTVSKRVCENNNGLNPGSVAGGGVG